MAEYEYHYSRFPALKAYIDRINAVQKNHKRFVVEQRIEKYPKTLATIRIVDKKIDCAAEEYAPTMARDAATHDRDGCYAGCHKKQVVSSTSHPRISAALVST